MMKHIIFKSRVALALVMLAMFITAEAFALDSHSHYFAYGLGQKTCEDYIKFREKKLEALEQQQPRYTKDELYDIVNRVVEQWIAGFLTAHNLYVSDTYNVVGKLTMDDVKARLETACRSNPKEYFAQAMVTVVQELNPQRIKDEDEK
jgi:hypothetical protein